MKKLFLYFMTLCYMTGLYAGIDVVVDIETPYYLIGRVTTLHSMPDPTKGKDHTLRYETHRSFSFETINKDDWMQPLFLGAYQTGCIRGQSNLKKEMREALVSLQETIFNLLKKTIDAYNRLIQVNTRKHKKYEITIALESLERKLIDLKKELTAAREVAEQFVTKRLKITDIDPRAIYENPFLHHALTVEDSPFKSYLNH